MIQRRQKQQTRLLSLDNAAQLATTHFSYNWRALGTHGKLKYDEQFAPSNYFAPQTLIKLMPELQGANVLDLGCGNGRLILEMERAGVQPKNIDGIDAAIIMLEQAQMHDKYRKLILGDVTDKSQFEKYLGTYSCIVSSCVFGHIIGRGHDVAEHMRATTALTAYFKHLNAKATIGLTLGNARSSGARDEQSTVYKCIIPVLEENGFKDIQMQNLPGHIDPHQYIRNNVKYRYLIARRY